MQIVLHPAGSQNSQRRDFDVRLEAVAQAVPSKEDDSAAASVRGAYSVLSERFRAAGQEPPPLSANASFQDRLALVTRMAAALPEKLMLVPPERPHLQRTIWVELFWSPRSFTEQFYKLLAEDAKSPILIAIDSGGGSAYGMLHIASILRLSPVEIRTCAYGRAMSAAFAILGMGIKGKRFAMPFATGMMHQAAGGMWGDVDTVDSEVDELKRLNALYLQLISDATGQSVSDLEEILKDSPQQFMTAQGMVDFGIVDAVATSLTEVLPVPDVAESGAGAGESASEGADG